MKNGKIGVTTENIFPVIKKFLYSDHEIFLRELISNAVDATQKLKTLSSIGEAKGDLGDVTIRVAADKEKKTLTVTDRGVGMTAEEVDKYINQIAFSGAEEFMEKYKNQAIIGHFGLGFYSAFMVSDKVEIFTKSYKEGSKTVHWSCTGSPEFEMEETDEARDRGTTIVLHLSEDSLEYAEDAQVEALLKKYCRFLPVPIAFGKVKDTGVPVICCGEPMSEIVPGTTDAAVEKHVPVWTVENGIVHVKVGSVEHPMLPEHYIEWVSLHTKQGNQRKELHPGEKPEVCFALCEGDEVEAVYAYCNLHSLWKA